MHEGRQTAADRGGGAADDDLKRADPNGWRLPPPEKVMALPAAEKVALRGQLAVLLVLLAGETLPPTDPALTPKEAAKVLGYSVDWLQREGPDWHARLVAEFGIGFIMQPVENGKCHYSLAGLELLKCFWRGERAPRR